MSAVTDAQGDFVLMAMADQGASLRRACKSAGCSKTSFFRWKDADQDRKDRYARAREAQIEYWADETLDIADDNTRDVYTTDDGMDIVNHDVISRAKLRVDTRKWLLSKLARDTYGDKTDHTHTGNITVVVRRFTELEGVVEDAKLIGDGNG